MRDTTNAMTVIPAIDLKDGQCVRLKQGLMEETLFFPMIRWSRLGIGWRRCAAPAHCRSYRGVRRVAGQCGNRDIYYPCLPGTSGADRRRNPLLETAQVYVDAGAAILSLALRR